MSFSRIKGITSGSNSGFQVAKNGTSYDFVSSDKSVIEIWMNALKNVCVSTTFHDEYKALKMIGRGSFAKVYLVESKTTGKMFAVKAFTKESVIISNKSNAKPSMLNEIDIMRFLDHDNIIKLYEVYETDKSIYLVLELIQGKSLQDVLKKSNFREEYSEVKIINMIRSILDALAYLASKGIMHRDLKPDNILLDKGEKIKIVDFGLATFIDVPEYIFKKCGTPGYIAPEVFKYDPKSSNTNYDDKCDVFSAGAILFYMLFGYPFFEGSNASEILRLNRKFTNDFEALATIKQELKNSSSKINKEGLSLCAQLCDFDHKKRISAAASLNHNYFTPVPGDFHKNDTETIFDHGQRIYKKDSKDLSLKGASTDKPNSIVGKADRFAEKDSLYLDMGRPEMNGKVDTITSGSQNNSLLLKHDPGSNAHLGGSRSSFSKQGSDKNLLGGKKAGGGGGNNLLKQAVFKNMANNMNEEGKDDTPTNRASDFNAERRFSADMGHGSGSGSNSPKGERYASQSPDKDDGSDVSSENSGVQNNVDKMKAGTPDKHPSKMLASGNNRRFTPFEKKK